MDGVTKIAFSSGARIRRQNTISQDESGFRAMGASTCNAGGAFADYIEASSADGP